MRSSFSNNLSMNYVSFTWHFSVNHFYFIIIPHPAAASIMIQFIFMVSRQGKVRLMKFFSPIAQKERQKILKEVSSIVLNRSPKLCNFIEWREFKIVYKRYASLYFTMCVDQSDNELLALETIQHYVELLDRYFGNVCELDLIFNFHKANYMLEELFLAGELQESSKRAVLRNIAAQDMLMEEGRDI